MPTRIGLEQSYLFPIEPRDLAESIGLDWWAAKKLYDDKWLSFDPEITMIDNDGLEAEFRFLGSLVAAGCDWRMLKRILAKLERPYRYDLRRVHYSWEHQRWIDCCCVGDPQKMAEHIISNAEKEGDTDTLTLMRDEAQEALERLGETGEESPVDGRGRRDEEGN